MTLLASEDALARLRCPVCGGSFSVPRSQCDGPCERTFRVIAGQPVLIDAATSIVDPETVAVPKPSSRASVRALAALARTSNPVAERIAHRLAADVRLMGRPRPVVLVVGGGSVGSGLTELYETPDIDLIGFDVYPSRFTQFVADAHCIPLADESVDAVIVQAVLEHVLDPWRVVAEVVRVLRCGGVVYGDTPFLYPVHEGPFDFTRFTESGHRWLFRDFSLIESGVVGGVGTQMIASIAHTVRSIVPLKGIATLTRLALKLPGMLVDRITENRREAIDGAAGVYFYGRKEGTRVSPGEMIAHYRGAQHAIARRH
jgi:SAM-dependent methyltransferase